MSQHSHVAAGEDGAACFHAASVVEIDADPTAAGCRGTVALISVPATGPAILPAGHIHGMLRQGVKYSLVRRSGGNVACVSLEYAGRLLLNRVSLNAQTVDCQQVPFPGGPLDKRQFQIIEHFQNPRVAGQRYLIVIRQPSLNPVESAISARIGGDLEEVNVDVARKCRVAGLNSPLLLMDGGWAIGGFLVLQKVRAWYSSGAPREARQVNR